MKRIIINISVIMLVIACTSTIVMVRESERIYIDTDNDIDSIKIGQPLITAGDKTIEKETDTINKEK